MSSLQAQALKEKKALEEAYEEGFDVIFNYGYGCNDPYQIIQV